MSGTTPSRSKANMSERSCQRRRYKFSRWLTSSSSDTRLRLVENEQHSALFTMLFQSREIACREFEDPTRAEDGLDETTGERAGRLAWDGLAAGRRSRRVDPQSIKPHPKSSSASQLCEPSCLRNGEQNAFGVGRTSWPGAVGP
jgi:hypothetical protein